MSDEAKKLLTSAANRSPGTYDLLTSRSLVANESLASLSKVFFFGIKEQLALSDSVCIYG